MQNWAKHERFACVIGCNDLCERLVHTLTGGNLSSQVRPLISKSFYPDALTQFNHSGQPFLGFFDTDRDACRSWQALHILFFSNTDKGAGHFQGGYHLVQCNDAWIVHHGVNFPKSAKTAGYRFDAVQPFQGWFAHTVSMDVKYSLGKWWCHCTGGFCPKGC